MNKQNVLIITGSLNVVPKRSIVSALFTHLKLTWYEKSKWLTLKIKLTFVETLLSKTIVSWKAKKYCSAEVKLFLNKQSTNAESNLTADTIAHYLRQAEIKYDHCLLTEIFYHKKIRKRLSDYPYIFLSTTFIHDLNELYSILEIIKTEKNKIIIGGALTATLLNTWKGDPRVKIVAIGYGEYLIPIIADWIKANENELRKPDDGAVIFKEHTIFLIAGSPKTKNLDFIEAPIPLGHEDDEPCETVYYESVRGCPFRCSFCNYPYLFNDDKFRYKSANKIVYDWLWYKKTFATKTVVVLDSLFTVPKRRSEEVANLLIEAEADLNWICYARADDLCDLEYLKRLKNSGLKQVQIGLESGNQQILNNMSKKTTVQQNIKAVQNCRRVGVTTVVSIIIGFPGETESTIEDTYRMLELAKPDFCFVVVFSTRVADVPVLSVKERLRFNLKSEATAFAMSPYWSHSTMSCLEASDHARAISARLAANKICLNPILFHEQLNHYHPNMFENLLEYQYRLYQGSRTTRLLFNWIHRVVNVKLNTALTALNNVNPLSCP